MAHLTASSERWLKPLKGGLYLKLKHIINGVEFFYVSVCSTGRSQPIDPLRPMTIPLCSPHCSLHHTILEPQSSSWVSIVPVRELLKSLVSVLSRFPPYGRAKRVGTSIIPKTNSRRQSSWSGGATSMGPEESGRRMGARSKAQNGHGRHWKV